MVGPRSISLSEPCVIPLNVLAERDLLSLVLFHDLVPLRAKEHYQLIRLECVFVVAKRVFDTLKNERPALFHPFKVELARTAFDEGSPSYDVHADTDRKRVVQGKSVSVRVD